MITTRPHGRPNGALLARIQRRLTPRWQTVAQIVGDDMVGDVARALSTLERDGLAEREGQRWRAPQPPEQAPAPERVACRSCGKPVEEAREVYGIPTCYACLPPPEPLPIVLRPERTELPAELVPPLPVDLPAAVQEAARRRDWWTRTDLATSVEISTGAGRGSIEVEIARQLDDGRLQTEARGIRIRVPPPPESASPTNPSAPPPFITGPELAAWRVGRGWSQGELAQRMVSAGHADTTKWQSVQAMISKFERVERSLPERWFGVLAMVMSQPAPLAPQQASASEGAQVDDDGLATPTRPLIDGQLLGELGPDRSAPTWPELLTRARRDGMPGLVDVTWGCGELAELLSSAIEALLDEEADQRDIRSQRPDVERRAILAVLDLLEHPDVDIVARVALLVGEVRTLRRERGWPP